MIRIRKTVETVRNYFFVDAFSTRLKSGVNIKIVGYCSSNYCLQFVIIREIRGSITLTPALPLSQRGRGRGMGFSYAFSTILPSSCLGLGDFLVFLFYHNVVLRCRTSTFYFAQCTAFYIFSAVLLFSMRGSFFCESWKLSLLFLQKSPNE
jgi:hypothetical protein